MGPGRCHERALGPLAAGGQLDEAAGQRGRPVTEDVDDEVAGPLGPVRDLGQRLAQGVLDELVEHAAVDHDLVALGRDPRLLDLLTGELGAGPADGAAQAGGLTAQVAGPRRPGPRPRAVARSRRAGRVERVQLRADDAEQELVEAGAGRDRAARPDLRARGGPPHRPGGERAVAGVQDDALPAELDLGGDPVADQRDRAGEPGGRGQADEGRRLGDLLEAAPFGVGRRRDDQPRRPVLVGDVGRTTRLGAPEDAPERVGEDVDRVAAHRVVVGVQRDPSGPQGSPGRAVGPVDVDSDQLRRRHLDRHHPARHPVLLASPSGVGPAVPPRRGRFLRPREGPEARPR